METFFSLDCGFKYLSNIAPLEDKPFLAATKGRVERELPKGSPYPLTERYVNLSIHTALQD